MALDENVIGHFADASILVAAARGDWQGVKVGIVEALVIPTDPEGFLFWNALYLAVLTIELTDTTYNPYVVDPNQVQFPKYPRFGGQCGGFYNAGVPVRC